MNLPNKLTVMRIIMVPFFLFTMIVPFPHNYLVSLLIFVAASLTDLIDGKIARKRGLITDFGKFLDPLADKMLTTAAFLAFLQLSIGTGMVWITFIVLIREFLITSLRLVSAGQGKVIAANIWGKAKTVSQMVAIIFTIALQYVITLGVLPSGAESALLIFCDIILWVSAVLTVISGIIYVIDNAEFIDPSK